MIFLMNLFSGALLWKILFPEKTLILRLNPGNKSYFRPQDPITSIAKGRRKKGKTRDLFVTSEKITSPVGSLATSALVAPVDSFRAEAFELHVHLHLIV